MRKLLTGSLSFLLLVSLLTQVFATTGNAAGDAYVAMRPALILLFVISGVLIAFSVTFTIMQKNADSKPGILLIMSYAATVIVLVCSILCLVRYNAFRLAAVQQETEPTDMITEATQEVTVPPTSLPTTPPTVPAPTYTPAFSTASDPKNWGAKMEIISHGSIIDTYQREDPISFGDPDEYFAFPGIATFRGNNYRNGASYGTATVTNETITADWSFQIGAISYWTGSGWTGQPLIAQWDDATKSIMNLYSEKKSKEGLVEVIHATLDGHIYFYDLDDGSYTRDPINVGMPFKGAGSLDPRGYPLMYVGSGDSVGSSSPRMYVISLIDGSILYERSGSDAFSQRSWCAFDSSPLVHGDTDTLIWPGESGLLYTIKLNTQYDKTAGTISVTPEEIVKTRYSTSRSNGGTYWIGYEPSAVIVGSYLYISENGGMFFCIDLNTMQLVWAQDTKDDSNSTPVFQWENGKGYLYTAPSLHWTASNSYGSISIYKLDAQTGEIVWQRPFDCYTVSEVSGGIQSSPLLGKEGTDLEGLIIYTVARTPNIGDGKLVALNTQTGEIVWELYMEAYSWSSPIAVYTEEGKSYIVVCDSVGRVRLVNATGEVLDTITLGANIEASPAAFNNTVVIGTRGQQIYGLTIS